MAVVGSFTPSVFEWGGGGRALNASFNLLYHPLLQQEGCVHIPWLLKNFRP